MALRRIFSRWLWPAAFVLPLWLLIGWGVFNAGGWAFLWVLFIALPSVFVVQAVLTLLNRARPSVRRTGSVSWLDVAAFTTWHVLTILVGLFSEAWFGLTLVLAIVAAVGVFWVQLWQLWRESTAVLRTPQTGVIVVDERR
ncbi:MFS transporter permease [Microbacterium stercoris]|uniref:MFS transporter permease n=1 Tax=Microbacterium stercoris TaxID=2820289 RepID=A0A939TN91_9MICO|nr:MFS transporter permease [Microbacterium stercoris]MBO3663988.1 MFS transporter permease [Microbacterium stercoris]